MSKMLVNEHWEIDIDQLQYLADDNNYWNSAFQFYCDIKDKEIGNLSAKQETWLDKIEFELKREQ